MRHMSLSWLSIENLFTFMFLRKIWDLTLELPITAADGRVCLRRRRRTVVPSRCLESSSLRKLSLCRRRRHRRRGKQWRRSAVALRCIQSFINAASVVTHRRRPRRHRMATNKTSAVTQTFECRFFTHTYITLRTVSTSESKTLGQMTAAISLRLSK